MYIAIRRFQFAPNSVEQVLQIVRDGFVPIIRQAEGFYGFYAVDSGAGTLTSISMFDTQQQAEESTRVATDYVREHMAPYLQSGPEVTAGEARVTISRSDS